MCSMELVVRRLMPITLAGEVFPSSQSTTGPDQKILSSRDNVVSDKELILFWIDRMRFQLDDKPVS